MSGISNVFFIFFYYYLSLEPLYDLHEKKKKKKNIYIYIYISVFFHTFLLGRFIMNELITLPCKKIISTKTETFQNIIVWEKERFWVIEMKLILDIYSRESLSFTRITSAGIPYRSWPH